MKSKSCNYWKTTVVAFGASALALATQAQTVTNPCPNRVISWNADNNGTVYSTNLAGLAAATNWVNSWPSDINIGLPDNTGATTTMNKGSYSVNTYSIGSHPGLDTNGTANREMLNGYLNSGPAGWGPWTTNTWVSLTNVPYAKYDVVVYLSSDTSGRHGSIDDGTRTYYFSTVGTSERSGANALFLPTTETNSSTFPSADFAFFPGMTNANSIFTEHPKSGNDQWLGIAAFQVIESSNVYVLYGPAPASLTISVGQPASFSVMAGGQNPAYQWRHAGTNILNATNATYSIASTTIGQNGNYDVIVTNSFSSMTSVVSTLTFYAPKTVTWDGNGSTWDVSSLYWTINGGTSTTNYADTDNVRFDPLGAAQSTVNLSGSLNPSSIVISNASYKLASSGSIGGGGSLHLMNNASLILDCVDTRSGPTIVDSGCTYQVDNYDSAGQMPLGVLTNNGTLLFYANASEAYGYPIYGSGSITNFSSAGTITLGSDVNANYLVQAGNGTLLLQGSNTLAGGLVVSGGYVWARSESCLGKSQVVLTGGELQLIYGFDFGGSSLTLSGGLLHGGVSGSQTFEGPVTLTTDSEIDVDGGSSLTLNNASGISASGFYLFVGGGGTLIVAGTNNSWNSVTINTSTLQIGNGGAGGSLGSGTITDVGALAFNLAGNLVVTNPITSVGAINQIGAGTVTLTADNNSAGFSGAINVTNGTLRINGTSGSGSVTVAGGTLGGTGTIGGPVTVLAGATLAPGASVGALTINSDLTLEGNLLIEVNKSLSPSNDSVTVSGTLANTGTGIVNVENLGPALVAGDKFTLFSKPVSGGNTLTVVGNGAVWTNNLAVDGSISVQSVVPLSHPGITNVSLGAGNIAFSGNNGYGYGLYNVLSSTNLAQTNWTVEATGTFDGSGNFSVTNAIMSGKPQKFYRLQLP
jgi:autotransporter-associated beta strand protein